MKIKWKNNVYKFKDNKWWILAGENLKYVCRIYDEEIIEKLNKELEKEVDGIVY